MSLLKNKYFKLHLSYFFNVEPIKIFAADSGQCEKYDYVLIMFTSYMYNVLDWSWFQGIYFAQIRTFYFNAFANILKNSSHMTQFII